MVRYSRSRSFKIIEIGTNGQTLCDFLLVFYPYHMPIFCRFRDVTI